jgi:hypothetical protein
MSDKKLKKIWDNFDDKTKASIKFLINELTQKKYQRLIDSDNFVTEKELTNMLDDKEGYLDG